VKRFKVALAGLDGQTVPDWVLERLTQHGISLVVRECVTDDDLAAHAADADVVWLFGGSRVITAGNLALLKQCGAILRTGSGTDNVPVEAATQRGIVVANTPDALTDAVSDHVIALLFAVIRRIAVQDRAVRGGVWDRARAWPLWTLQGRTLGLVGFGRIARVVARKLSGFEMTVLTHDPFVSAEVAAKHGVGTADLDEVLARADVVSVHCPSTPATRHLIGERALRLMKTTAVLVNTARGPVIDESALIRALTEGWIAGAGLDVLEQEPPDPANPLLRLDNVVITPHIGAYSNDYLENSWRISVEALVALAGGRWPSSHVNRPDKPRWNLHEDVP
jgi:D-3-phosphoglycerate dehydrogenase / 2-oxoglutarate reductase